VIPHGLKKTLHACKGATERTLIGSGVETRTTADR
jgi:hypothetical protein